MSSISLAPICRRVAELDRAIRSPSNVGERIDAPGIVTFEESTGRIEVHSTGDSDAVFVMASAVPHPHNLALGYHPVHASATALRAGELKIAELGTVLSRVGDRVRESGAVPVYR